MSEQSIDLYVDPASAKKYNITFANGDVVNMVCYNAHQPQNEVAKWNNPIQSVENIVSIEEVQEFPST